MLARISRYDSTSGGRQRFGSSAARGQPKGLIYRSAGPIGHGPSGRTETSEEAAGFDVMCIGMSDPVRVRRDIKGVGRTIKLIRRSELAALPQRRSRWHGRSSESAMWRKTSTTVHDCPRYSGKTRPLTKLSPIRWPQLSCAVISTSASISFFALPSAISARRPAAVRWMLTIVPANSPAT